MTYTYYTQNKISVSTKITIFERRRRMVTESITDSAQTPGVTEL